MHSDLALLKSAAQEAGEIALSYFRNNPKSWLKSASSSVSEADMAVDAYLKDKLLLARQNYGWLSEETTDTRHRLTIKHVFVADPIDGTRGFLQGSEDWCISLAVIEDGVPKAAVVHAPALNKTYSAERGHGAFCNEQKLPGAMVVDFDEMQVSGTAIEPWSLFLRCHKVAPIPSLALRLARVASGELAAAFSRPNAHDWDIAGAHLLLEEAGGLLIDGQGNIPFYNRQELKHPALGAFGAKARIFLESSRHAAII
jgi:myo-inositol-1(or 4)-monophosphatase